jgi:hypothetical protein
VRRLRFDGRPITLACSGQLVTEPSLRHLAPGAFLLRRYFGPVAQLFAPPLESVGALVGVA